MPRPRKADRPIPVHVYLPESLHTRLTLLLWSEVEGRIPQGAWSEFFITLANEAVARLAASQPK